MHAVANTAWWHDGFAEWSLIAMPAVEVVAILAVAWLLRRLLRGVIRRVCDRYGIATELAIGARRLLSVLIYTVATMLVLARLGVSGAALWTALTGFTAVAAIAFFAAWSVLSNLFCSLLILTTRPFRVQDHVELLEGGDKPGLGGRVVDINLLYTTLLETDGTHGDTVLQVPNSQFFQRITRRWRSGEPIRRQRIDS